MNRARASAFLELTKPRLTAMALVATLVGFLMASRGQVDWLRAAIVVLGAALVGGGGNALNQWYERDVDALMRRTQMRPLPTQRLAPRDALIFGLALSVAGVAIFAVAINALTACLAAATVVSYVCCYTPLKRVTSLCTLVGAVPGALPPLIGWAGACGSLGAQAWMLFGILFLWQLPHFLAIAWVYRDDYERAGFRMAPSFGLGEWGTARQMVVYTLALLTASLLPTIAGLNGPIYFAGAFAVGVWFVAAAVTAASSRSDASARRLFLSSIAYLPVLFVFMLVDRVRF